MGAIQVSKQQREAFEAYILKTKVPALIEKCGGELSVLSAEMIIQSTWLGYIFGTDEFAAEGTRELFELWKAAQAQVSFVVVLPEWEGAGYFHFSTPVLDRDAVLAAIEAAGGTVKS